MADQIAQERAQDVEIVLLIVLAALQHHYFGLRSALHKLVFVLHMVVVWNQMFNLARVQFGSNNQTLLVSKELWLALFTVREKPRIHSNYFLDSGLLGCRPEHGDPAK